MSSISGVFIEFSDVFQVIHREFSVSKITGRLFAVLSRAAVCGDLRKLQLPVVQEIGYRFAAVHLGIEDNRQLQAATDNHAGYVERVLPAQGTADLCSRRLVGKLKQPGLATIVEMS